MGADPLQVVPSKIQAPQAHQAGEGAFLNVGNAVVPQVQQVKAGEIPEVCTVDPLD